MNTEALPILEKDSEIPESSKPEDVSESLPTFGISVETQQVVETVVVQDKSQPSPQKRNFEKYEEEHKTELSAAIQDSKKIKPGWGINYKGNQDSFMQFRQERKIIETKRSDPLELLDLTDSQEAVEHKKPSPIQKEEPQPISRPPETKLQKPSVGKKIQSEEEKAKTKKPFSNAPKSFYKDPSPEKTGKLLVKKILETSGEDSRDSTAFSFGKGKPAYEPKSADKAMKQSSLEQFAAKRSAVQKTTLQVPSVQPRQSLLQSPRLDQYQLLTPKPQVIYKQPQKPIQQTTTAQQYISPRKELEPEDEAYLNTFPVVTKFSPLKGKLSSKKQSPARLIDLTTEAEDHYLRTFQDLSSRKTSPSIKSTNYIQNPYKQGSQIDLGEFKTVSTKLNFRPSLSSSTLQHTLIQNTPPKLADLVKPTPKHFTVQDFQLAKMLFEQS